MTYLTVRRCGAPLVFAALEIFAGCSHQANSSLRPLAQVFEHVGDVTLNGVRTPNVMAVACRGGDVYITDSSDNRLKRFDSNGHLAMTAGGTGSLPGQLRLPYGMTIAPTGDIYVLDLKSSRVNIFAAKGQFKSSFTTAGEHLLPTDIAVDDSGNTYLSTFRGLSSSEGRMMIHKYDSSGRHVTSFLAEDPLVERLRLFPVAGVRFIVTPRYVFAAQRVNYTITRFTSEGMEDGRFGTAPRNYHAAVSMPEKLPNDKGRISDLLRRWTQLDNLHLLAKNRVLASFHVYAPAEYEYAVYSFSGQLLDSGFGGPLAPACSDPQASLVYFRAPTVPNAPDSPFTLSVYSVK